jgi:hypothetical protein
VEGLDIALKIPDLWQQEALRRLQAGQDVVVQAPTGAGKTYIFELLGQAGWRKSAVFTVPTRALANDKLYEWRTQGWNVGIATGDVADNLDAPVVVATLETQKGRFLRGEGPGLLVVDEYQMLGDPVRGVNYELILALDNRSTQLLLLCATSGATPCWSATPSARCRRRKSNSKRCPTACRRGCAGSGRACWRARCWRVWGRCWCLRRAAARRRNWRRSSPRRCRWMIF